MLVPHFMSLFKYYCYLGLIYFISFASFSLATVTLTISLLSL